MHAERNPFLYSYLRVAVRAGGGQPFRWFAEPVPVILLHSAAGYAAHEDVLAEAVFFHPTQHIRQVEVRVFGSTKPVDWDAGLQSLEQQS